MYNFSLGRITRRRQVGVWQVVPPVFVSLLSEDPVVISTGVSYVRSDESTEESGDETSEQNSDERETGHAKSGIVRNLGVFWRSAAGETW